MFIYNFWEDFFNMEVVENCPQNARNCTILKKFIGGACPQTPLAKARSFAASDMPLRGMYIHNPRKFKVEKSCIRRWVNTKPLNKYIDVPVVMTPYFEDLIGLIGLTKPVIFSKFDIRMAFHQLKLSNRAKEICSFSTFMGCYSYVRSPMGISDIPAPFNNIINQLIGHIEGVFTYADDVCLFSPTYEHHIKILKEVLHIFEKRRFDN